MNFLYGVLTLYRKYTILILVRGINIINIPLEVNTLLGTPIPNIRDVIIIKTAKCQYFAVFLWFVL